MKKLLIIISLALSGCSEKQQCVVGWDIHTDKQITDACKNYYSMQCGITLSDCEYKTEYHCLRNIQLIKVANTGDQFCE